MESEMFAEINITSSMKYWVWSPVSWSWGNILQLILALVGVAGNLLVMLVLYRPKRKRCSTDTLIAALAVADFLTSIFIIPHASVLTLPESTAAQFYCRIIHSSLFMWISICASIFTLSTLSLQTFVAVKYPYTFEQIFSPSRTVWYIVFIWIASVILNTPVPIVVFFRNNECAFAYPNVGVQKFVGTLVFLIEYIAPVAIMIFSHVSTIRALNLVQRCSPTSLAQDCQTSPQATRVERRRARSRRKVINMFFIVVITFVVCWTPDQVCYFALNIGWIEATFLYSTPYRSFVLLAFVNSCANPFIYAARNANFRMAVREMLKAIPRPSLKPVFDSVTDTGGKTQRTNECISEK